MGQGQVSNHSGTSWDPVITVNSYKVIVLIMFLLNYVTHQYTNATPKKSWRRSVISDCSFSYFLRSTLLYDPTYSRCFLRLLWLRKCWRKTDGVWLNPLGKLCTYQAVHCGEEQTLSTWLSKEHSR